MRLYLLLVICFSFSVHVSLSQSSSSTQAKAKVLSLISLENTNGQGLQFGVLSIGNSNSTIRVPSISNVEPDVCIGDAVVLNTIQQTAAKYTISGELGSSYNITLPSTISAVNGTDNLVINNFTCSNGTGGTIGTNDVFYIGADLNVPSTAVPGPYVGTFSVVVSYN